MPIEIDQSNKIERTNKDTILAFSDGQSLTILIPAKVKRQVLELLISRGKSRKIAYQMIFAAGLFILLRDYLRVATQGEGIVIDMEYSGQEASIKAMLLRHAHNAALAITAERIEFLSVGKESRAHKLAWGVQRGGLVPDYRVSYADLDKLL
jgi:hypothetical protein